MLSTLKNYGRIEIDQCLAEVPVIENNRSWSHWNMTAVIARMHNIEFVRSEMVGQLNDPDASDLYLRVNDLNVKLRLERKTDGTWGTYLFDQAKLVTPAGKEIEGKVPTGVITALKAYFPSHSPKSEAQPQPN